MANKQTFIKKCFICKQQIEFNRNNNEGVVYFDNHFYHEHCLESVNYIKKTCFCCSKSGKDHNEIHISSQQDADELIFFDNHYYHKECFVEMCSEKNTKKWKNALKTMEILSENTNNKVKELLSAKQIKYTNIEDLKNDTDEAVRKYFLESDINYFIKENYSLSQVTGFVWKKLCRVYNGDLDGMTSGIPPEHLLDMWNRKMPFLNKIRSSNISKGKDMTNEQRVIYDLSILVNKYDSYLNWLEEQKVLENENNIIQNFDLTKNIITNENIHKIENKTENNSEDDDMDSLLDEIFG